MLKRLILLFLVPLLLMVPNADAKAPASCAKSYSLHEYKTFVFRAYRQKSIERYQLVMRKREHCQRSIRAHRLAHEYRDRQRAVRDLRLRMTDVVVEGGTSTFAGPAEGDGQTADGRGTNHRICIAMLTGRLGTHWLLEVQGRKQEVVLCDRGPYAGGRVIDITGWTLIAMGINPYGYANGWGKATLLRD